MQGKFDLPSVDHLREGVDYVILDWDFAASAPVPHTPGQPCPPGHKMIWGMCRRLKAGTEEWNPEEDSDLERAGKIKAQAEGSKFENNKPVEIGGQKYGWAKKGGKEVLVAWGSVAGTDPKNPKNRPPAAAPATTTTATSQPTAAGLPPVFT